MTAIDNDPDALQNARENVARNRATDAIDVLPAELSGVATAAADVVIANLTGAVLLRYADVLQRLVTPGRVPDRERLQPG